MKNRYVSDEWLEMRIEEVRRMFTYVPPDAERQKEHKTVNAVLLSAVEAIVSTCPDTRETQMAIDHLWFARMCANGAIATYDADAKKDGW